MYYLAGNELLSMSYTLFSTQKAPRTGLNTSLLLQKRHLGLLQLDSYCRYCITLNVCTHILYMDMRLFSLHPIHITTPTAVIYYRQKTANQCLTLTMISSGCVEWVFFTFDEGFKNILKCNNFATVWVIWINVITVARVAQLIYINPTGKHFNK